MDLGVRFVRLLNRERIRDRRLKIPARCEQLRDQRSTPTKRRPEQTREECDMGEADRQDEMRIKALHK
jgi:hypothetical protein